MYKMAILRFRAALKQAAWLCRCTHLRVPLRWCADAAGLRAAHSLRLKQQHHADPANRRPAAAVVMYSVAIAPMRNYVSCALLAATMAML